jgi:hypothetical protein
MRVGTSGWSVDLINRLRRRRYRPWHADFVGKSLRGEIAYTQDCNSILRLLFVTGGCDDKESVHHAFALAAMLVGCGIYTPDKDPFRSDAESETHETSQGIYETAITTHVACELGQALAEAEKLDLPWLMEWGTTVTQTVTVEDQTGLSPGISSVSPLKNTVFAFPAASGGNVTVAQSFSLNVGGTASANALRTETIQYTFKNSDMLWFFKKNRNCLDRIHGVMIDGDLKIREFVYDKALIAHSLNLTPRPPPGVSAQVIPPYNVFTEEITFVASYGASLTPTWHLARFTANASSNLLVGQRTNTNDLVITLGPIKCPALPPPPNLRPSNYVPCPNVGPVVLVDAAMNQHLARVQANAIAVSVTGQAH